jgi:hypothetical protein
VPGLTLLTPTGARPEAFALCEKWLERQTYQGEIQWLVADDGPVPTPCTMGQTVIRPEPFWQPGENTQFRNLLALFPLIKYDKIVHWEDDDWYGPGYLETVSKWLDEAPLVGEIPTRYYNVRARSWNPFGNDKHASLCQTGMRPEVLPVLKRICEARRWVDMALWKDFPGKMFAGEQNVGIKGLPGRPGQVGAHQNPRTLRRMVADPNLETLRSWIGEDAEAYRKFGEPS